MSGTVPVSGTLKRARGLVGDWGQQDVLTVAVATTTATTINVADTTLYKKGDKLTFPGTGESMRVTALTSATILTVVRGIQGSTAVTMSSGQTLIINPAFHDQVLLDGINEGQRALWPYFYNYIEDESITTVLQQADYALPASLKQGRVLRVSILEPSQTNDMWYDWRQFEVRRDISSGGEGAMLHFTNWPPVEGSTVRLIGIAPFQADSLASDNYNGSMQDRAINALPHYAAYYALMSGESQRDRNNRASNIGPGGSPAQVQGGLAMQHLNTFYDFCGRAPQAWPSYYTRRRF